MPLLARAGHLKPLGKPGQNARKWYARVEREWLARYPAWLDKAIRVVDKLVRVANGKQTGKGHEEALMVLEAGELGPAHRNPTKTIV